MEKDLPYRAVSPPRRERLSDSIAAQIEQAIVTGALGPGHTLPAERVLSKQFGVSRPSLREALLRLEARGLLKVARGGGFAVTDVTAPTVANPLAHLLQGHPTAEQDVLELRHGLELVAAHFAAQRATKADHAQLRLTFERMAAQRGKYDAMASAQCDAEFHLAIAEASHNVALIHVMHGLHNLLRATMRHAWDVMYREPESVRVLHEQHHTLLDAMLAGDAELARDAAHLHLSYVRETLQQQLKPSPSKRATKAASQPAGKRKVRRRDATAT
jgi:GntR family transcriptional regulator, transcriptional repressor for pyruvate dehydrogenase complex